MGLRLALRQLSAPPPEGSSALRRGVSASARRGLSLARALRALATDPHERARLWLAISRPGQVHQTTTVTWLDRYPDVFAALRTLLGEGKARSVLSYGCSTGEEVVSLRQYLPLASIVGAEINPRCLAICRQRNLDSGVTFIRSSAANLAAYAPFDAILCMAVLQRTPHLVESQQLESIAEMYPFQRFDEQITRLDELLKVGGCLVVRFTQYRFTDASVASRYRPVAAGPLEPANTPYFGRDSVRVTLADPLPTMWEKVT